MSNNISQAEIYRAAKNVIHNDLGITKEYINNIVQDTVKAEVNKLLNNESYITSLIKGEVLRSIYNEDSKTWHLIRDASGWIKDEVTGTIVNEVKNKLEIRLKDDYEGHINLDEWEPVKDEESGHYVVRHKVGLNKDRKDD